MSLYPTPGIFKRHPPPVFGYLPHDTQRPHPIEGYNDLSALTHIMHVNAEPAADGTLTFNWTAADQDEVLSRGHAAGCKVLITVGGNATQSQHFEAATVDAPARATLIGNIIAEATNKGYDGIDINWEPMHDNTDQTIKDQFLALHSELRIERDANHPGLLLTCVSFGPGAPNLAGDVIDDVDYLIIQGYFMHAPFEGITTVWHQSALFGTIPNYEWLLDTRYAHIPRSKLVIGMPFFGVEWQGGTGTSTGGVTAPGQTFDEGSASYQEVNYMDLPDLPYFDTGQEFDATARVPYLSLDDATDTNDRFLSYDDASSLTEKVDWLAQQGIGGVSMWTADRDLHAANAGPLDDALHPLLTAMRDEYESHYGRRPNLQPVITETYSPIAVATNGDTWGQLEPTSSIYTGAVPSKQFCGAFALRIFETGVWRRVIRGNSSLYDVSILSNDRIEVRGRNSSVEDVIRFTSNLQLTANIWYMILWSVDLNGANEANCRIYINDFDRTGAFAQSPLDQDIAFDATLNTVLSNSVDILDGEVSDLWVDFGRSMDLGTVANRRKFFTADNRLVDKDADGSTPFGAAPILFFSGAAGSWLTNKGTGGGVTVQGTGLGTSAHPPLGEGEAVDA